MADLSQKTSLMAIQQMEKLSPGAGHFAKGHRAGQGQSQGFNSGLCDSESALHVASEMGSARGVSSPGRESGKKDNGFGPLSQITVPRQPMPGVLLTHMGQRP